MKVFAATSAALVAAAALPGASAWWDNGHMMVGQVATLVMNESDVETINQVLSKWDDDFPNTGEITTAAIWPDLIKCTGVTTTCKSPLSPSITSMSDWHYIDLPINVSGEGVEDASLALFDESLGGDAVSVIEGTMKSFKTTKSNWAANLMLRTFIHIFGDLHQPLHAVAGVSEDFPEGDGGGNSYVFEQPCGFTNLHALWDAAGGEYSLNNWAPSIESFRADLVSNATELISWLPSIEDPLDFSQYENLTYTKFVTEMVTDSILREVVLDTYSYTYPVVYASLDLNVSESTGKVACPSEEYLEVAAKLSKVRIATGGNRLAVVLTQIAKQLRTLGLA